MKIKSLAAAAVMALASVAQAATLTGTTTAGGSYTFDFVASGSSFWTLVGSIAQTTTPSAPVTYVKPTTFSLTPAGGGATVTPKFSFGGSSANLWFNNLVVGNTYTLTMVAPVVGTYTINSSSNLTPVPEPGSVALVLAGVAVLGFALRRQASKA